MLKPLASEPLKQSWLETKPSFVVRDLELAVPPRSADPEASFKALIDVVTGVDTRRLTTRSARDLSDEFLFRAHLLLDARSVAHWIEPMKTGARLCLKADANDTSPLGRFANSWHRRSVGLIYNPRYLVRRGARAYADTTNLLVCVTHQAILDGKPGGRSLPHESAHIDTQLRQNAGEATPYQGRTFANAKRQVLPGGRGHYAAHFSLDELRTFSRDLRELVRALSRVDLTSATEVDTAREAMRTRARQQLRNSLQAIATLKQTRSRLNEATITMTPIAKGFAVTIVVHTRRHPHGYTVTLPLLGIGDGDPRVKERIIEALDWRIETARGHLAMTRIAVQAEAAVGDDTAAIPAMCSALNDVLAQRHFARRPGIAAPSYETLLERYNRHVIPMSEQLDDAATDT